MVKIPHSSHRSLLNHTGLDRAQFGVRRLVRFETVPHVRLRVSTGMRQLLEDREPVGPELFAGCVNLRERGRVVPRIRELEPKRHAAFLFFFPSKGHYNYVITLRCWNLTTRQNL
jgi:hypothetical protein